jgi:hypothetical protein
MSASLRPATASEIIEIVGQLDDGVIVRIQATGATPAQVLEGFTWATADDQIGTELRHGRQGAAGAVYEILIEEDSEPEDRAR